MSLNPENKVVPGENGSAIPMGTDFSNTSPNIGSSVVLDREAK
jgi:hypothetical protein